MVFVNGKNLFEMFFVLFFSMSFLDRRIGLKMFEVITFNKRDNKTKYRPMPRSD